MSTEEESKVTAEEDVTMTEEDPQEVRYRNVLAQQFFCAAVQVLYWIIQQYCFSVLLLIHFEWTLLTFSLASI